MFWELNRLIISSAVLSLVVLFLAATCGGSLIAVITQVWARIKNRKLLDNFALQICKMALSCIILILVLLGGLIIYLLQIPARSWPADFAPDIFYLPGAALVWGTLFLLLGTLFWKKLKSFKIIRLIVTLLSFAGFWLFVFTGLNLKLQLLASSPAQNWHRLAWEKYFFVQDQHLFWGLFTQLGFLAIGAAGLGAMLYMLLRRTKEDFGRDYYRYGQNLAAKWSLFIVLQIPAWACIFFQFKSWPNFLENDQEQIVASLILFLLLVPLGCSLRIIRSMHPMRHKLSPLVAFLFSWAGLSAIFLSYARILLYA